MFGLWGLVVAFGFWLYDCVLVVLVLAAFGFGFGALLLVWVWDLDLVRGVGGLWIWWFLGIGVVYIYVAWVRGGGLLQCFEGGGLIDFRVWRVGARFVSVSGCFGWFGRAFGVVCIIGLFEWVVVWC